MGCGFHRTSARIVRHPTGNPGCLASGGATPRATCPIGCPRTLRKPRNDGPTRAGYREVSAHAVDAAGRPSCGASHDALRARERGRAPPCTVAGAARGARDPPRRHTDERARRRRSRRAIMCRTRTGHRMRRQSGGRRRSFRDRSYPDACVIGTRTHTYAFFIRSFLYRSPVRPTVRSRIVTKSR
jgi:hypothetical protein